MDRRILKSGRRFAAKVREELNPYKILMYGSQVYGNPTEYSDIDIAVIFDGYDGDEWKTSSMLCLFAWYIDKSIEPVLLDLKHDRSGFAEEIMKIGIEL